MVGVTAPSDASAPSGITSQVLIDAIVRQTTVLIAQLATNAGARAPLAHIASRVFNDLARELEAQGISRKVSADMFGLALRTYQRRIRAFSESATLRGQSLWEAVLGHVRERPLVSRSDLLLHFSADDETTVRAVLQDLTESGLVFRSGVGHRAVYRASSSDELGVIDSSADGDALESVLWVIIRREGPLMASQIQTLCRLPPEIIDGVLARLIESGRVQHDSGDGEPRYSAKSVMVSTDSSGSWQAGVLDHFHAVVRAVLCRLNRDADGGSRNDTIGGSTYSFQIWKGHPYEKQVLGILERFRDEVGTLRRQVDAYNSESEMPARCSRVTAYAGQSVIIEEEVDANG